MMLFSSRSLSLRGAGLTAGLVLGLGWAGAQAWSAPADEGPPPNDDLAFTTQSKPRDPRGKDDNLPQPPPPPRGDRLRDERGPGPDGRPPRPPGPPGPLFAALDTNRDGELSAPEIRNAARALRTLDTNRDGKLDRHELRPRRLDGPPPGDESGDRRRPDGPPPGDERGDRRRPDARRPDGPPEGRAPREDRPPPPPRRRDAPRPIDADVERP